jgi:hypothetical protein
MDNLIIDLFNKKIIKFDTSISTNFNILISYPYIINNIVKFIYDKIKLTEYTNIIGFSNSTHIASILSYNHNIPLLMLNKNNLINGEFQDDNSIIIINDVIDTGNHLLKYITLLESNKLNIKCIINIYDTNNSKIIDVSKYNINSLFTSNYITNLLISKNILNETNFTINKMYLKIKKIGKIKKSKICYECNQTNIKDIITNIDNIGGKIIMIKLCSNKISNFNITYGNALRKLANNHNFFILNDLGIYNTNHIDLDDYEWCDIITTYNPNLKTNIELVYINNKENINTNILGSLGYITNGQYLNISNTINTIDSLKKIKNSKYDIIVIDNLLYDEKIIKFINSN